MRKKQEWYEKYSQTGITVKMHTNHDGVRATVIMLRSIAASSSSRSPVIARKKVSEITSTALRVNKELALISFPMRWVEGHMHQSQQACFTALSSPATFMFSWIRLSFIHKTPWAVFFRHMKTLACFYEPQFDRISLDISLSDFILKTKKNFRQTC